MNPKYSQSQRVQFLTFKFHFLVFLSRRLFENKMLWTIKLKFRVEEIKSTMVNVALPPSATSGMNSPSY